MLALVVPIYAMFSMLSCTGLLYTLYTSIKCCTGGWTQLGDNTGSGSGNSGEPCLVWNKSFTTRFSQGHLCGISFKEMGDSMGSCSGKSGDPCFVKQLVTLIYNTHFTGSHLWDLGCRGGWTEFAASSGSFSGNTEDPCLVWKKLISLIGFQLLKTINILHFSGFMLDSMTTSLPSCHVNIGYLVKLRISNDMKSYRNRKKSPNVDIESHVKLKRIESLSR